jgi:hypothetical protein
MNPALWDAAIAGAALALFGGAYAVAFVITRPRRVAAGPATPDLGDEPPAVVNLLANRWRLTDDAAEATLLDLAARGYLELRQPGEDPHHTTIHLRRPVDVPSGSAPLLPYEQRVLDRVEDLAVQQVVPLAELAFRDRHRAHQWHRRLRREVATDARARGLSRRRFGPTVIASLMGVAAVSATWLTVVCFRIVLRSDDSDLLDGFWMSLFAWLVLLSLAAAATGERDTDAGRAVAARWLGLKQWLRGHEEFGNLPPAAVTVWDRYLPYGAALGVTHTTSAVLDLGMGDRTQVWSSHGGVWRRVHVRYPKLGSRYGKAAGGLLARSVLTVLAGGVTLAAVGPPRMPDLAQDPASLGSLLAAVLVALGGYVLVRTLVDLASPRTITGQVLWVEKWRSHARKNRQSVPWLDYLAIDDGEGDRTTAWGLPRRLGADVHARDVVTIRVRPWTRRVLDVVVVEHGRTRSLRDAAVPRLDGFPADPGGAPAPLRRLTDRTRPGSGLDAAR